jgi:hypothetical protein
MNEYSKTRKEKEGKKGENSKERKEKTLSKRKRENSM